MDTRHSDWVSRRFDRTVAAGLFGLAAYLVVPWQYVTYGRWDFEANENLVFWIGSPVFYALGRLAWAGRIERGAALGIPVAALVWFVAAWMLTVDPHGYGPRHVLLLHFAGPLPVAAFVLGLVLALRPRRVPGPA